MKKYLLAACLFWLPSVAAAWEGYIPEQGGVLIGVDKEKDEVYVFDEKKQISFSGIHGRAEGDKQREGDLKTPEGIYFVTGKIDYPLDFIEYGSQAHALNYPNPVDRLRGKSGSGIWIHSKGLPLAGQSTRGCVAVDLDDIETLSAYLTPGTPVVIAQNLLLPQNGNENTPGRGETALSLQESQKSGAENSPGRGEAALSPQKSQTEPFATQEISEESRLIGEKSMAWAEAWSAKSEDFFAFYDKNAYSCSTENFVHFAENKRKLFQQLPWIKNTLGSVEILEGPDYHVSWFHQLYQSPWYEDSGIRRLYWQKTEGEFRIVGMEWIQDKM